MTKLQWLIQIYIILNQTINYSTPMQDSTNETSTITFKPTSSGHEVYKHPYNANQTIQQIKQALANVYGVQYGQIKLIFKGKVLIDKNTAAQANLENAFVMLVIGKKAEQPKKNTTDQTIPKIPSTFNTGMGSAMPVGFGGYGIVNHPQYMSAISGAVNEEKMEEMLDDPVNIKMMEEMMQDPQTLKYLIQQNPMLQNMIKQNPSMKMILDNPALMKAVFNPQMLKMSREMMKNQGNNPTANTNLGAANPSTLGVPGVLNGLGGMGGLGNMGAMGGMGGTGGMGGMGGLYNMFGMPQMNMPSQPQGQTSSNTNSNQIPQIPMGNPMFGMGYPGYNPFLNSLLQQQLQNKQAANTSSSQISIEQKYKVQLKQLESMGFKDRQQNIKALIESKGDVDGAIERLCKD